MARHRIDPGGLGDLLGFDLVAHRLDRADRRADESNAFLFQAQGEILVLAEEPIAGMHGLGPGLLAGLDDAVDDQIAFGRGRGTDRHSLAAQRQRRLHMQRLGIGLGIDRDGGNAHLMGGAHHAAGDFAPVGDQDLLEHRIPLSTVNHFCNVLENIDQFLTC